MKEFSGKIVYQGDIAIERVSRRPAGCVAATPASGRLIVAHSETGHHHYVEAAGARFYGTSDPLICYLTVSEKFADVVHARQVNPHETFRLPKGTYRIRRQREWTPEGWRAVQD